MKIIEKKCPNCGANLKFNIGDKEIKCEYCQSEFVIDNNQATNQNYIDIDSINLSKKVIKTFGIVHVATMIIPILIFVAAFVFIFTMAYKQIHHTSGVNNKTTINDISESVQSKLSKASRRTAKVWDGYTSSYQMQGDYEDVGFYYLVSDDIKIIYVLKAAYSNGENQKVVYSAYEFSGNSISSLDYSPMPKITRYELDDMEHVYGYESIEELYDGVVRSEKDDYKIIASEGMYID